MPGAIGIPMRLTSVIPMRLTSVKEGLTGSTERMRLAHTICDAYGGVGGWGRCAIMCSIERCTATGQRGS